MVRITVGIEGMACGMCEAHISEAVRNSFKVKKVTSSHTKKQTVILVGYSRAGTEKRSCESRLRCGVCKKRAL